MISQQQKVAIIMPTFNGEKFIAEQIDSILNQTHRKFELHIFDDHSRDRTLEICHQYQEADQRVFITRNDHQKGVIQNVNDGLAAIDADIYFLADQDDVWNLKKMELQLLQFENLGTIMSFTNLLLVDADGNSLGINFWTSQKIKPKEARIPEYIALKSMVTGCTMAFRKELLDIALPIPQEALMHDHWLSFFAAVKGKVGFIDQCLTNYRQHGGNVIGAQAIARQRQDYYSLFKEFADFEKSKLKLVQELGEFLNALEKRLLQKKLRLYRLNKLVVFYSNLNAGKWVHALFGAISMLKCPIKISPFRTLVILKSLKIIFLYVKCTSNKEK